MLRRKSANEYYQMRSYCKSENEPKQNNIDFESERIFLIKEDDKMVVKRRFERIIT